MLFKSLLEIKIEIKIVFINLYDDDCTYLKNPHSTLLQFILSLISVWDGTNTFLAWLASLNSLQGYSIQMFFIQSVPYHIKLSIRFTPTYSHDTRKTWCFLQENFYINLILFKK